MKFNVINDLNKDLLKQRAYAEASEIFSKESTRHDRSIEEIRETVLYGQAAEVYLMQYHNFTDDSRPYKDVFNSDGIPVEVKVTEGEYYVPYVIQRCEVSAIEKWRQYPKIVYVFIGNKSSLEYNLHGVYNWNGTNFIKETE